MAKVLGMGNALIDIVALISTDDLLTQLNILKGSMQLVEKHVSTGLTLQIRDSIQKTASGGSAANTIYGLAHLGVETAFLGKIGKDEWGEFFLQDLENSRIKPLLIKSQNESGRAIALISPDCERTFATFLGAAVELSAEDILPEHFEGYDVFHVEGYLVQNHELLKKSLKLAKENNLIVSLDLSSYNIVTENLDFLHEIISKYVDIVFANEDEARAFTGKEPEEALDAISELCDIAIVKIGKNGSLIKRGNEKFTVGIIPANSIDTTGAGDLYASGFLYGMIKNKTLDKCGLLGSLLSGKIIEELGAKYHPDKWDELRKLVEAI